MYTFFRILIVTASLYFGFFHLCSAKEAPFTIESVLAQSENLHDALNKPKQQALLLVSLSMPEASLQRLARDAKDAGIPLVFRGVPKQSEEAEVKALLNPDSLKAFAPLIEIGASVELNPEVFRQYNVKQVPALLLSASDNADSTAGACSDKAEDALIVRGDVTLGYMLDQHTDREDAIGQLARDLRQKLGNRA